MTDALLAVLSSAVFINFITTYFWHKKTERQSAEIKREFDRLAEDFEWKKQSARVLGQIYLHINRTNKAMDKTYSKLKVYDQIFENEVIYASNKHIRDLILDNGHFIPPDLHEAATALVEHYDAWLCRYQRLRIVGNDRKTVQIYVGPLGYPFPSGAEEKFKKMYIQLFGEITVKTDPAKV